MVLSLDRWVGKVAVVTGASSGIGAAITEFLVEKGINVAGLARRVELVQEKAKQLSGKPAKLYPIKADVSKESEIVAAFKCIEKNLGPVHILINNAGIAKENCLYNGDAEAWRSTLDVNVLGPCITSREAIRIMRENKINGHIINLNSVAGHKVVNLPNQNLYTASKYAVTALTETLRNELMELGSRIKLTSLSPGLVASEMTVLNKKLGEDRKQMLSTMPILKTTDIAEAVGYVLSTPENVQINELTITPLGDRF